MFDPTGEILEKMAEALHQVWMEEKLKNGWRQGDVIDKERKMHTCLVPYDQLSETDKESDRDVVRGIPKVLALAGLRIAKEDE